MNIIQSAKPENGPNPPNGLTPYKPLPGDRRIGGEKNTSDRAEFAKHNTHTLTLTNNGVYFSWK